MYAISLPEEEKREQEALTCQLGKEIHLKHAAPVLFIQVMDASGYPLPEPGEVKSGRAKAASTVGNQRVLICSEEQFKLFTLPGLKPFSKFKLTAHEGAKARRINLVDFVSKTDDKIVEHCFVVVSNLGEISVHTLSDLKRQLLAPFTKKEDIDGISTSLCTRDGQGFYLQSSGEFKRFSMSAKIFVRPLCSVNIPDDARPKKEEPEVPVVPLPVPIEQKDEEEKREDQKAEESKETKEKQEEEEAQNVVIEDREGQQESPSSGIGEDVSREEKCEPEEKKEVVTVNGEREEAEDEGVSAELRNGEPEIMNGDDGIGSEDPTRMTNDTTLTSADITIDSVRDHMT